MQLLLHLYVDSFQTLQVFLPWFEDAHVLNLDAFTRCIVRTVLAFNAISFYIQAVFYDFLVTAKAAPRECVIGTGQP